MNEMENNHPLSPNFWSKAEHTEWNPENVDDMLDNGFMDDTEGFYYGTGIGFGYAQVFDEDGSHPMLLNTINTIVECNCGYCGEHEMVVSFGFPLEMGFEIINMIQTTLDHYQQQHGPLREIDFGDAG